jgi:hypothetical protein
MSYAPERDEHIQKLDRLVRAIVACFPIGWRVEDPPADPWRAEMWLHAYGPEPESEISFHANWRESRLSVSGTFPKSRLDTDSTSFGPPYGVDRPSALVSMARPAHRLADDLKRRVLYPYLDLLEEAVKRRDEYDAARNAEREMARRLAELVGVQLGQNRPQNEFGACGKVDHVRVSHCDGREVVDLKLRNLPTWLAETIIRQVQAQEADEKAAKETANVA